MKGVFSNIDCYLFDLDGTLIDSSPLHESAYRKILSEHWPHLLPGFEYRTIAGLTTASALRRLGLDETEIAHASARKQTLYREMIESGLLKSAAGAQGLLEHIVSCGATVGVVTSARRATASRALEVCLLSPFVRELIAAEDSPQAKPLAAPFVTALERLDGDIDRSIAVEDAVTGIESARAARLKVVGVHERAIQNLVDMYFSDLYAFRDALR